MRSILLVLAVICAAGPTIGAEKNDNAPRVAAASTDFTVDLYSRLRTQDGNLIVSPYSVYLALGMTYAGAQGRTEKEMAKVLRADMPQEKYHASMERLQRHLGAAVMRANGLVDIRLANALFVQKEHTVLPGFSETVTTHYGADWCRVDFKAAPDQAVNIINDWVAQKTRNRITDVIGGDSISTTTRLVLVNAVYFKGVWARKFEPELTEPAPFSTPSGTDILVSLMHKKSDFLYGANDLLQIIELPYSGNDLSMVILLPRDRKKGLAALESALNAKSLAKWLREMKTEDVALALPRFAFDSGFSLLPGLSAMGMKDAFVGGAANFRGIDGTQQLFLNAAIHRAGIAVNEAGTEAWAATIMDAAFIGLSEKDQPFEFRADHPFLFLIRDERSGIILFIGRVVSPDLAGT